TPPREARTCSTSLPARMTRAMDCSGASALPDDHLDVHGRRQQNGAGDDLRPRIIPPGDKPAKERYPKSLVSLHAATAFAGHGAGCSRGKLKGNGHPRGRGWGSRLKPRVGHAPLDD